MLVCASRVLALRSSRVAIADAAVAAVGCTMRARGSVLCVLGISRVLGILRVLGIPRTPRTHPIHPIPR